MNYSRALALVISATVAIVEAVQLGMDGQANVTWKHLLAAAAVGLGGWATRSPWDRREGE